MELAKFARRFYPEEASKALDGAVGAWKDVWPEHALVTGSPDGSLWHNRFGAATWVGTATTVMMLAAIHFVSRELMP